MKTTLLFVAVLSGVVIPTATTRIVYFSAVDAKGQFVTDLTAADVVVEEDGQARDVIALEPATESCHVAIVVDDGGEGLMQTPVIELLNAAAGRALFSISMLNPQLIRLNDFTSDVDKLEESALRLVQRGRLQPDQLVLADTVSWTAKDMQKRRLSRPVIVILTNGGESAEREVAKTILEDLRASGAALHVVHVVAVARGSVLVEGPTQSGGSAHGGQQHTRILGGVDRGRQDAQQPVQTDLRSADWSQARRAFEDDDDAPARKDGGADAHSEQGSVTNAGDSMACLAMLSFIFSTR